jgi:hypothetical protein
MDLFFFRIPGHFVRLQPFWLIVGSFNTLSWSAYVTSLTPWATVTLVKPFPYSRNSSPFMESEVHSLFTKARHWFQFWATWLQFMLSYPVSLGSFLLLSSHRCIGLPYCLFPSSISTKILYKYFMNSICSTFPAYLILRNWVSLIIFWEKKVWTFSLGFEMKFQIQVTFSELHIRDLVFVFQRFFIY